MKRKRRRRPIRMRTERRVTVSRAWQQSEGYAGRAVPAIRMRGEWLQQIGFREGTRVHVAIEPERLVLTIQPAANR